MRFVLQAGAAHAVMAGYLNDPDATARFFREGWFYTGDTGSITEERALAVAGRSSERINAGGVKVAPEIIESAVQSLKGVQDCAAFRGVYRLTGVEFRAPCLHVRGPRQRQGRVKALQAPRLFR